MCVCVCDFVCLICLCMHLCDSVRAYGRVFVCIFVLNIEDWVIVLLKNSLGANLRQVVVAVFTSVC